MDGRGHEKSGLAKRQTALGYVVKFVTVLRGGVIPQMFSGAEMRARQGKRALPTGSLLCVNDPRQVKFDTVLRRKYVAEM